MKFLSHNPKETVNFGKKIAGEMKGGEALCLYGNLGSGKTTFVRGLINYFLPSLRILSPTFIIVRQYHIRDGIIKNILHVDLYRLTTERQIEDIGITEYLNQPDTIVAVEWAQKLKNLLPAKRIDIRFQIKTSSERIITVKYE